MDFLAANYVVDSRAYNIRSHKYLVPGGDFVNHSDHPDYSELLRKNTKSQGAEFLVTHRVD